MQTFKTARTRITVILLTLALIIPSIVGIILANGKSKSAIAADVSKTTFTLQEELSKIAYTDEELAASGWDGSSRDANKRALFETAFEKSQLKFYVAPYQTGHTQREFYTWANDGSSWYLSYTSINGMCAGNTGTTGNGISTASNGFTIYSDANKLVWSIAYVAPSDGTLVIPEHTLSVGWFGGSATAFQLGWSSDNGNRKTMSNTDSALNWNTYSTGSYTIKAQTYNLKAGQTVYLNMFTVGASTNNIKYNPTFEFTTVKYEVGSETVTLTEELSKVGYTEEEKTATAPNWNGTTHDADMISMYELAFAKSKLKYYAGANTGSTTYQVFEYYKWATSATSNSNYWKWSGTKIAGLNAGSNLWGSDKIVGLNANGTHYIGRPRGCTTTDYKPFFSIAYTVLADGVVTIPATTLTVNSITNATLKLSVSVNDWLQPNEGTWAEYNEVKTYDVEKQTFNVTKGNVIYINMYADNTTAAQDGVNITYNPQFVFVESSQKINTLSAEIGKMTYTEEELAASGWDGSARDANKRALYQVAFSKSDLKFYSSYAAAGYPQKEYYEWCNDGNSYRFSYMHINDLYSGNDASTVNQKRFEANGQHGVYQRAGSEYALTYSFGWTAPTDGTVTIPEHTLTIDSLGTAEKYATSFDLGFQKSTANRATMSPNDSSLNWVKYTEAKEYTIAEQTWEVKAGEMIYINMFANTLSNPVEAVVQINYDPQFIFEPTSIPAEGEFTGASISTASDFGLNFYANVDTAGTVKATAECGDDVKTLTGKYDAFAASWKFTYPVAAKDFDKDVKVTISEIDGVAVENGDSATYSVSKYIDYVLADETGAYDDVKELVANLKEYCDAAQSYFDDSEVVKVTDGVVSSSDLTDYDATVTGEDANVVIQGATLILESKTTINVYFTAPDNTTVCKVNGNEVVATKIDGVENLYVVSVEVVAKDLGVAQVFEIGGYTVNYSAYTYIGTCVDTASDALYNVLQALYDYGVSAYEYSLLG